MSPKRGRVPGTPSQPGTIHVSNPETNDERVHRITPEGIEEIPIVDDERELEPLAICPGGCHVLMRLPDGEGEVWAEVRPEAREHWAQRGLPVREPS